MSRLDHIQEDFYKVMENGGVEYACKWLTLLCKDKGYELRNPYRVRNLITIEIVKTSLIPHSMIEKTTIDFEIFSGECI